MAYAAYRELLGETLVRLHLAPRPERTTPHWMVLDVTVHSCDALKVRRALVSCPDTGVLRCIPLVDDRRARLEIRLEAYRVDEVMHRILLSVPDGEIGHLLRWSCHLQRQGLKAGGSHAE